jgi:preprotein translocase subunit SecA
LPSRRAIDAFVERVGVEGGALEDVSDALLHDRVACLSRSLRTPDAGENGLATAFAMIREMARRHLGTPHRDVQLEGGLLMSLGRIAEMETGEGKTLAATLPACTGALSGVPVHVVSANDYLVERDAEAMRPLYEALGLRVGAVTESMRDPDARREAYACDVTYATTRSLAFDHLRDVLSQRNANGAAAAQPLLRGLCFAVLDEADAILIDDAHTPLVLAAPAERSEERRVQRRSLRLAASLQRGLHFRVDAAARRVEILDRGRAELETLAKPLRGAWAGPRRRERWVSQALRAMHVFHRDRDYLVTDGAVHIIDPTTGRAAPERSWEQELHALIELKEGCPPRAARETLARISVQRFYRRYLRLAGTTGTASESAAELRRGYGLSSRRVPTHRPCRRVALGTRVFPEARRKWLAVVERIREVHAAGRPVLVATGSVAASEHVATLLRGADLPHRVLNARQDAREAEIVAQAGLPGRITVATRMAGRGTDIALHPESEAAGGLHVIATQIGEPARIERQLAGRAGRQGDPGSHERIYALEDEAATSVLPQALRRCAAWLSTDGGAIHARTGELLTWLVRSAEEARRARQRRDLVALDHDLDEVLAFSGPGE